MNPFRKLKNLASISTPTTSQTPSSSFSNAMDPNSKPDLTVIELFQSQSCSSCPPANSHLLSTIPTNASNALLLTYEVTYWNHLSWIDTFSDARWDKRQRDYVRAMGLRAPFTPQVIVDGGATVLDQGWWNIGSVLTDAKKKDKEVVRLNIVDTNSGRGRAVEVIGEQGSQALVQVVWYEVEPAPVKVLRGENRGVTLDHRNVVRDLAIIGTWEGGIGTFELPAKRDSLEMAVLVQKETGGHILGAVRA
ncbi:hypothetical protein EG329_000870 [Mollisiaceae sp. DMI_Dod_QoI]|nr:hypothetical protein EG329_000870 [Helotiales sp. DMI_Dod_QoI]